MKQPDTTAPLPAETGTGTDLTRFTVVDAGIGRTLAGLLHRRNSLEDAMLSTSRLISADLMHCLR